MSRGVRRNALVKALLRDNKEWTALPIWCNYTLVVIDYYFGTTKEVAMGQRKAHITASLFAASRALCAAY